MVHTSLLSKMERAVQQAGTATHLSMMIHDVLMQKRPVELVRLNPFALASALNVSPWTMLDIFIHGTRNGLLEWGWDLVCPLCGFTTRPKADRMDATPQQHFYCSLCDFTVPSVLDDTVEVSFNVHPDLVLPVGNPHSDVGTYLSYYASQASPHKETIQRMLQERGCGGKVLQPGESVFLQVMLEAGVLYRLVCLDTHDSISFQVQNEASQVDEVIIEQNENGFEKRNAPTVLPAGNRVLKLVNKCRHTVINQMFAVPNCGDHADPELAKKKLFGERLSQFGPRVTAKILLNSQVFRNYYGVQKLDPDLRLKVRDLTLLFTDLKGSTALYDRTGDMEAYRLVRDHFVVLKDVVRRHCGAVVKTMGDAIMATFSVPQDGVRAALEMLEKMMVYSTAVKPHELGLKIGLHSGPALTVNAGGQLDFFGQTVNIAARIQGLAQAGEICISDTINSSDGIEEIFKNKQFFDVQEEVILKGVSEKNTIHRYCSRRWLQ